MMAVLFFGCSGSSDLSVRIFKRRFKLKVLNLRDSFSGIVVSTTACPSLCAGLLTAEIIEPKLDTMMEELHKRLVSQETVTVSRKNKV